MAASALDAIVISSTSKSLALLDLTKLLQEHFHRMEGMDIDPVDVPDTPDRLAIRKNGRRSGEKENISSVGGKFNDSELLTRGAPNGLRGRGNPITGNGSNNLFYPQQEELSNRNDFKQSSSPVVDSADVTSPFKAHLFRGFARRNPRMEFQPKHSEHRSSSSCSHGRDRARLGADCSGIAEVLAPDAGIPDESNTKVIDLSSPKINGRSARNTMIKGDANIDRGKGMCAEIPSRHSSCINKNDFLNLTGRLEQTGIPERACAKLKDSMAEEVRRGSIAVNGFSSLQTVGNSSRAPSDGCKGKTKIGDTDVASNHMKSFSSIRDSSPNTRETMLESQQPIMLPRRTGQKRLVRNGCISPFNIERAKQFAEKYCKGSEHTKQADVGGGISSVETPSRQINTSCHDSESNHVDIVKGKRVLRDANLREEHEVEAIHLLSRNDQRLVYQTGNGDQAGVETTDRQFLQCNSNSHLVQSSPVLLESSDRVKGQHCGASKPVKRQKKQGSTRNNVGECSTSSPVDSGIAHVLSCGETFNARSTRRRNPNCQGNSSSVIVIDELSPETRSGNTVGLSQLVNNGLETRARQMEADEIMARQLQAEFYSEMPGAAGELDAQIARALQEEDSQHFPHHGNLHAPHPRAPSVSRMYRQYPSRPFRNRSARTTNRAQPPRPTRNGSSRARSRILSSGGRSLQFPSDMDFETRIDILEAVEAAVGNSNDMRWASHVFQRDLNENDYELLLALDENNHQHVGASAHHINSLPQSTVEVENFDEACAICLDTPGTGDIIRHLPCLHKFHKDCIDPWLRRSTSCPVCKSSIT